jgi:putative MATE family efflux protein
MKKGYAPLTLGTADISKLLLQYALPSIIGMVAMSVYNITDSIFIGHGVGVAALSGLSITFPIMNLSAAFGTLVGVGAAAILSIRLGQKDYSAANYILGNVIVLNTIIGLLFSAILLLFLNPILIFFGASSETIPHARAFLIIILAGNLAIHMYMGLNALMRSSGHPKKAMYATIITILINLILNYLFIFKFGWGIQGSASATIISQVVVLVWQIWFFCNKNNFIYFQKKYFRLEKKVVSSILSIGLAPFLLNSTICVIIILINQNLSFYGGDLAVGAYGIVNRTLFLFVMIVFGLNQGMQPIAGYNYGATLYNRVSEVLKKTLIFAISIMTFGLLLVELFPYSVAAMFTPEQSLIDMSVVGLRYTCMLLPLVGFQVVAVTFFQSIGKAHISIFLSLTRQVLFLIPLIIILPKYIGISGVWISMPISDFVAFTVTLFMLIKYYRSTKT